jgi:hypothetical protein
MQPVSKIMAFAASWLLASCDPLALGYVNRLPHSVTIVERGRELAATVRLSSGESRAPGFGSTAESIDVVDSHGRLSAHYRTRDIPRAGGHGSVRYIVITPRGPEMQFRDHLEYDE